MLRINQIIIAFVLLFLSGTVIAQPRDNKRFRAIENEKIAYITKELKLSIAEAERFFPIYNQYNREMWDVKTEKASAGSASSINAKSLKGNTRDVIAFDAKEVQIKKNYRGKFAQVIGAARASQFFEVEQRFRENLIKELRSRKR